MRFKRWILHRAIVADIAVQCASVSINRSLNGSGGVYALDVPTPTRREPPLVQLRPCLPSRTPPPLGQHVDVNVHQRGLATLTGIITVLWRMEAKVKRKEKEEHSGLKH